MTDYLIKRPMLLSGIICCIISFEGIYLPQLLLPTGICLAALCGILIFKKTKPELLLCIILTLVMLCNTFGSLKRAESQCVLDGGEYKAELVLREVKYKSDEYHGAEIEVLRSDTLERGTSYLLFTHLRRLMRARCLQQIWWLAPLKKIRAKIIQTGYILPQVLKI